MNILTRSDSYKYSHYKQYKPGTTKTFSYIESRGGKYDKTVFFGLQAFIKEYLSKPFTQEDIDEAEAIIDAHMGPGIFNREGFEYILDKYDGFFPVKIKAVPEGSVVPNSNVLVTIESTDENCIWVPSFLETAILRAVWYSTTVATNSWSIKQVIKKFLEETSSSVEGLNFSLHDFGARGTSSSETAMLGGMAHIVNFFGTDTVEGLVGARKYYDAEMPAFSVPAMEHSTVTIYGREGEAESYRNMIKQFGGDGKIVACVADSYDIYNAVDNLFGDILKDDVVNSGGKVVIRPDSGDPATVVLEIVQLLDKRFGTTTNAKGYKELPPYVGVIQGDGINEESIKDILGTLKSAGYASSNVIFGMGGKLLQAVDRDTNRFALKTSWAEVNGEEVDVFKDPVTDIGKRSKKGRVTLFRNKETGDYLTGNINNAPNPDYVEVLTPIFVNGTILKQYTFDEVRANVEK